LNSKEAATVLAEIAYRLRHFPEQGHRARAFSRAAANLSRLEPDLTGLRARGGLESIEGVGSGIAKVLAELVDTGRSSYLERLREEAGEAAPAAAIEVVETSFLRGDLHCHSDWSDGRATVLEMATAARARGYSYVAITRRSTSPASARRWEVFRSCEGSRSTFSRTAGSTSPTTHWPSSTS